MRNLLVKISFILCTLLLSTNSVWAYWTTDRDGNPQADNASIKGYVSNSGSTYYVLDDATERHIDLKATGGHVEHNYNINGPAAVLTFQTRKNRSTAMGNLKVAQRVLGGSWSDKYDNNPGTSYEGSGNISLDEKAVELSFYNEWGGGTRYFKDVKVTMASYCNPETASVAFGSNTYLSSENKSLKVYWSNMGTKTISKSGDTGRFDVSLSSIPCSAGYYGNTVVTITYKRDAVGSHTMTLTINGQTVTVTGTTTQATTSITSCATASEIAYNTLISTSTLTPGTAVHPTKGTAIDGTWTWQTPTLTADCHETYTVVFTPDAKYGGGYSTQTCEISIPITQLDQTITWGLAENVEYATGTLMDATATSGLTPVTYTSSNDAWAYVNENNRLVVVEPNKEVVITAHQAGDCNWNAAPDVTKTIITLGANPNQYTDVHASNITYGDLLSASTLSGKVYLDEVEIAGTLSWVDPMIMPVAGTANHMVLFTPTNTAAYSSIYFEVPVTVAKANPVITWNISTALRENTIYSNFVVSTNNEMALTITEASDDLSVSGLVLTVGEIGDTEKSGITLTAHQDASANYNEVTSIQTVTIYPKVAQCLPVAPLTEDKLGKMGAKYDNSAWCSTNSQGTNTFATCEVHYTQAEGIALGTWQDGFTGFDLVKLGKYIIGQAEFTWSTKWVELSFTGIPDRLSFTTELQSVSFNLAGWHEVNVTGDTWKVYQKAPGGSYTQVGTTGTGAFSFNEALNEDTRYIKIEYTGNFAGFVKGLTITRKETLTVDKANLVFGTEANPLQMPQAITLSYSSLGDCAGDDDHITVTSNNSAFYVDEATITEGVGIEQKGTYIIRVRCNDVNKSGKITFESNDGKTLEVLVSSTKPAITTTPTAIFQTGTEHAPASGTSYRALRTHDFSGCFNGAPVFDTLYIYGVSESSAANRQWSYDASKGYKVPAATASNVHTPCFVYKKDGAQYTYARTFDASAKTLNVADSKKRGFVGYRAEAPAANAIQVSGASAEIYLNNTEIVATGAPLAVNATSAVHANGTNILSSTGNAAVQLSGATTLSIEDTWKGATSAILALRPAVSYPSIDLGSASGRVDINGTQLELHNNTAHHLAIAHMDGTTEKYDGEVHINDGSIGGEATLGMPKATFIDGGTFNDGTVAAYTVKGMPKRPRNSNGDMLSRHTMTKEALISGYSWYGHDHLTLDGAAKVNPMLMDEEVWIFNGADGAEGVAYDKKANWNKDGVPGKDDDVLINAPMVIDGGEMKVKSLTINWENKGRGIPAVTVNPAGGLTVGEGGIDGLKVNMINNLALKADNDPSSATKGQTGFLRVHPSSAEPMPEATVELYSIGYYDRANATDDANIAAWQCVGAPIEDAHVYAKSVYTQSWVYSWDENRNEWVNNRKNLEFEPFKGFETTQFKSVDGVLLTYTGQLVSGAESRTIPLAVSAKEKGYNLLANSYSAPMVISQFQNADFVNAESTIYILNAGTKDQSDKPGESKDAAGKFIGVPINLSPTELEAAGYPTTVSSMQGFWVKAKEPGETAQLALDYSRLVWGQTYKDSTAAKPLRVPQSQEVMEDPISGSLKVAIQANGWTDYIYLLESENFDTAYEDGYDAHRIPSGDMDIFTIEDNDYLGLDATNSIVGTRVGMRTGAEVIYIMSFSHLRSEKELALIDNETNQKININEGTIYPFYAAPNSEITDRFQIVARNDAPTVTTGVDGVTNETKAYKFIKDGQMYILKNGVLYNATGAIVR